VEQLMPIYRFRIRDRFKCILAEDDIVETDTASACRAAAVAVALFTFSYGAVPGAIVELEDVSGRTIAHVNLTAAVRLVFG
jgi:hypothetical protein